MSAVWYRYINAGSYVVREEHPIEKVTPHGVWIHVLGKKKFVLREAHKRYACPSDADARKSFIARKRKQLEILKAQMIQIEEILARPDPFENTQDIGIFDSFEGIV